MQTIRTSHDQDGAIAEVVKVRETAEKLANGDYPEEADHVRVLAGLIHQLAEPVERLNTQNAAPPQPSSSTTENGSVHAGQQVAGAAVEEDITPERAPAQPLNDRTEQ
jgi:hypothetical protein